ncbi:MAG: UDP-N-acetylmuramoyl-L-alanine--D-glutamate ligase, partial [Chloroflexota bacterium]
MVEELNGKQIVILGFARQGMAFARFAVESGAKVIVSDLRSQEALQESMDQLKDLPIEYILGDHPQTLLDETDLLLISGGVPADLLLISTARQLGIPVSNDSQEFSVRCPAIIVGITGSAGKTT